MGTIEETRRFRHTGKATTNRSTTVMNDSASLRGWRPRTMRISPIKLPPI